MNPFGVIVGDAFGRGVKLGSAPALVATSVRAVPSGTPQGAVQAGVSVRLSTFAAFVGGAVPPLKVILIPPGFALKKPEIATYAPMQQMPITIKMAAA
jgi:hypothetical protein